MLVVSPSSVLHVIPADQKSTKAFIDKHADIKRHDYFRGMAGLNLNNARNQSYHWTRLDNVEWIWHKQLGAIVAVTTATALQKNGPRRHGARSTLARCSVRVDCRALLRRHMCRVWGTVCRTELSVAHGSKTR